jgi:glycosyltransferase involved in cell wall biosynthesis
VILSRPTISIVVCAYTEARWASLVEGIQAVMAQTVAPDEVIVVCDHNQGLYDRAKDEFTEARVLLNCSARGLSAARNCGVAAASGEIVAFLDDDAIPNPDWLEHLVAPLEDVAVVGTGGVALPRWSGVERPGWFPEEFLWVVGCSYRGLPQAMGQVRNPIGCSMAFRRSMLNAAGGFALTLGRVGKTPLGCEETELAIRIRALHANKVILHVPTSKVVHEVTAERITWRYFRARCFAEGLSKAAVASLAGSDQALSSERTYVTRTLPSGFFQGVFDGLRGKPDGLKRAGAIAFGLFVTAAGYVRGTLHRGNMEPVRSTSAVRTTP